MAEQQQKNNSNTSWFPRDKLRPFILLALPIVMVIMGWYNVYSQSKALEDATIKTYQEAELEVVKNAARAATIYIQGVLEREGRSEEVIHRVEVDVLRLFVKPIKIGSVGDAWIYSPDYVIFDDSEDFPKEYMGKNMAQIFELQKNNGASHYEEMTQAVLAGKEGTGWYIWDPNKAKESAAWWEFLTRDAGHEIAAWTPVTVFEGTSSQLTWVIGMSSMLPEIMRANGAYAQIQYNIILMSAVTLVVALLLFFLLRAETQVQKLEAAVAELKIEINEARKAREVSEVVETEYFQNLSARVKDIRDGRRRRLEEASESDADKPKS
jgi:hypothetical protein